jgi:hypothetical protein
MTKIFIVMFRDRKHAEIDNWYKILPNIQFRYFHSQTNFVVWSTIDISTHGIV